MINNLARIIIDCAADTGSPLPAWVRKRMARDPALADYDRLSRSLVTKLRADATNCAQETPNLSKMDFEEKCPNQVGLETAYRESAAPTFSSPETSRGSKLRLTAMLAMSAALLIIIYSAGSVLLQPSQREQPLLARGAVPNVQPDVDLQPIVASWAASQEVASKISGGTRRLWTTSATTFATPAASTKAGIAEARRRIRDSGTELGGALRGALSALALLESREPSVSLED